MVLCPTYRNQQLELEKCYLLNPLTVANLTDSVTKAKVCFFPLQMNMQHHTFF